jgi:hypothetical protein
MHVFVEKSYLHIKIGHHPNPYLTTVTLHQAPSSERKLDERGKKAGCWSIPCPAEGMGQQKGWASRRERAKQDLPVGYRYKD